MTRRVPKGRVRACNEAPVRAGAFVLYWMIAARRTRWNFGLQRAIEHAAALRRPLVVLDALRCDYPYASERFHRFVLDGMADTAHQLAGTPVACYSYVEPRPGAGKGLLEALGTSACCVVTDEFPCFFLPRMVASAARRLPVRLEAVDSIGLLPLGAGRPLPTAYAFRRFLQKTLPGHLGEAPAAEPLRRAESLPRGRIPRDVARRWPLVAPRLLEGGAAEGADRRAAFVASLPIDHAVPPVSGSGGAVAARRALAGFLEEGLPRYAEERNDPDAGATSGLSAYLHFGHLSVHEVFARIASREGWSPDRLGGTAAGRREGWWGMSASAEAFLDQLVTWRELGYNASFHRGEQDRYEALPAWARTSLEEHVRDPREALYARRTLEEARTADPLWNAAQRELLREGRIHNALRMLWGKRILEWTRTPQEAWDLCVALNDRHALDGRDPNSYSGIGWVFGRYDRPWGPRRPIFGTIRYMSSAAATRKLRLKKYLARFGERPATS